MRKWLAIAAMVSGAVATAPASAQNASFSGSATVINPSFFTSTVSAERVAPRGTDFVAATNFTVTPTYGNVPGTGIFSTSTKSVNVLQLGVLDTGALIPTATFTAAAAAALNTAAGGALPAGADIEAITAIIRAGAGVDGLE
ncbi:MAG: hypothetical protein HC918_06250 [Oscillatoriales cyanobacterium SM2_1_8]|nr:hypothetical protein [Oscillatoriales cyanobacterium SM2_1_8]